MGESATTSGLGTVHPRPPILDSAAIQAALARLAIGFIALFACLLGLGRLADEIHEKEAIALDAVANPFLHNFASPQLDAVMSLGTYLGTSPVIPVLATVAVAVLVAVRRVREALFLVTAIAGSFAINTALKLFFERPRPQLAWAHVIPEYSFPSGHAENGLTFYLALAIIIWALVGRRTGAVAVLVAVVLALFIGTSRIYFGYHYLSDVLGGYLAALCWLLVVGIAFGALPLFRSWRRGSAGERPTRPQRRGSSTRRS